MIGLTSCIQNVSNYFKVWYPERVSFIRLNTHKYKYKFFSYKKVAPKVAPFFVRCATGGGISFLGRIEKSVAFCKPKLWHSHFCPADGRPTTTAHIRPQKIPAHVLSRDFHFRLSGGHCGLFSMGHEFNPPRQSFAVAAGGIDLPSMCPCSH